MHHLDGFSHTAGGARIARKGWIEPEDCINCLNLDDMKAFLRRLRQNGKATL